MTLLVVLTPVAGAQGEREGIEDLLKRAREARDAERAQLEPQVEDLLDQIVEAVAVGREREADRHRAKILDLGVAGARVLLGALDTASQAPTALQRRADEAADLLGQLTSPPVLEPLLELSRAGADRGRLRAIRVLGFWKDPKPVTSRLIQLTRDGRRAERLAAVTSLARLGGPDAAARFTEIMDDDSDPDLLEQSLVEIGRFQHAELTSLVDPLMRKPANVVAHIGALMDFFSAAPTLMTEERAVELVQMVRSRRFEDEVAIQVLERLGRFGLKPRGDFADALEELERFGRREIAEAAMVSLALCGDSSALRRLEQEYTRRIEDSQDPDDYRRYMSRALMYLRVDEPKKARKDFEKAIDLDGGRGALVDQDLYVGLARALIRLGDLRKAAQTLEDARLGVARLKSLAADPEFAELRESRYGSFLRDL